MGTTGAREEVEVTQGPAPEVLVGGAIQEARKENTVNTEILAKRVGPINDQR